MAIDPRRIEVLDPMVAEIFSRMTPAERAQRASDAHRFARVMVESHVQFSHPDWSPDQIRTEFLRRLLRGAT